MRNWSAWLARSARAKKRSEHARIQQKNEHWRELEEREERRRGPWVVVMAARVRSCGDVRGSWPAYGSRRWMEEEKRNNLPYLL
jgi:hypothetical protein